jgi:amino acid transporter
MTDPTTASPTAGQTRLSARLGAPAITFMVIAAAAPLTVIGGNSILAIGEGPGAGAPVGFLLAAVILLIFSVGFVTLTPYVKEAGAFYSYVGLGLGSRASLGTALVALVAYTAIQVGVYGYAGWAVGDLVNHYDGPEVDWWVWSLVMLAVVAVLGYRHIELSAAVLGVALVLEILVVVVMDLAVVGQGGAEGLSLREFTPAALEGGPLAIALLFALTGFIGYEAAAVFRDEAKDPNRTIPRATYAAVLIIGIFYAISTWAIVMAWGPSGVREIAADSLASGGNLMLDTSEEYAGSATTELMRVLLVTSLFACVLSFHNIVARYQFTLAHRGVLPAPLGRIHPRHNSPSLSSVVQTVTALVIVVIFAVADADPLIGVFGSMAGVATTGMVSMMVLTSVAVLVFFARRPDLREGRVVQTTIAPALATVGLLIAGYVVVDNFALVTGAGTGLNVLLMGVIAAAFVLGVLHPRHRMLESEAPPEV